MPSHLFARWERNRDAWLQYHPPPWTPEIEREYQERFSRAIEAWLDAGHGSCLLRRKDCAVVVAEALRYFDGVRISMISFVVMPNHVHALFVQNPAWLMEKLIHSWKRFIAREINKLLTRSGRVMAAGLL